MTFAFKAQAASPTTPRGHAETFGCGRDIRHGDRKLELRASKRWARDLCFPNACTASRDANVDSTLSYRMRNGAGFNIAYIGASRLGRAEIQDPPTEIPARTSETHTQSGSSFIDCRYLTLLVPQSNEMRWATCQGEVIQRGN